MNEEFDRAYEMYLRQTQLSSETDRFDAADVYAVEGEGEEYPHHRSPNEAIREIYDDEGLLPEEEVVWAYKRSRVDDQKAIIPIWRYELVCSRSYSAAEVARILEIEE